MSALWLSIMRIVGYSNTPPALPAATATPQAVLKKDVFTTFEDCQKEIDLLSQKISKLILQSEGAALRKHGQDEAEKCCDLLKFEVMSLESKCKRSEANFPARFIEFAKEIDDLYQRISDQEDKVSKPVKSLGDELGFLVDSFFLGMASGLIIRGIVSWRNARLKADQVALRKEIDKAITETDARIKATRGREEVSVEELQTELNATLKTKGLNARMELCKRPVANSSITQADIDKQAVKVEIAQRKLEEAKSAHQTAIEQTKVARSKLIRKSDINLSLANSGIRANIGDGLDLIEAKSAERSIAQLETKRLFRLQEKKEHLEGLIAALQAQSETPTPLLSPLPEDPAPIIPEIPEGFGPPDFVFPTLPTDPYLPEGFGAPGPAPSIQLQWDSPSFRPEY